jgi:hypothetical protein
MLAVILPKIVEKMKKTHIIILIFLSQFAISQTINDLDIKNGFRNFKLGSSPLQNKNIVKYDFQSPSFPTVVSYIYNGTDLKSIFGVEVESVELSFFKNKLFSIQISFGDIGKPFELHEFNSIQGILEQVYGTKWDNPSNDDGVIANGSIWDGKNVRLELIRVDFSKSKTNPKQYGFVSGFISVTDKKLIQEMYKSNF